MSDDRKEFEHNCIENSIMMGSDRELYDASTKLLVDADRFRYSYLWKWLGVPIIQLPADVMAVQEIVWECKPDVIVDVGVARGGSVVFLASMLQLCGKGKVIGVDIDIRAHNRETIERHPFADRISLVNGSSTDEETINLIRAQIPAGAAVMVILDSDHSYDHVLKELNLYHSMVTKGQYLIVADTILGIMSKEQTPTRRSQVWEPGNEPYSALKTFLKTNVEFEVDKALNGKLILSSSPNGYLKRVD